MKYFIQYDQRQAHNHFLNIEVQFNTLGSDILIAKLPAWRPGRYELGNFAKNVKDLKFYGAKGELLNFAKRTKDEWMIHCHETDVVIAEYSYFASELNAGASFVDEHQFYINPVNCLLYQEFKEDQPCELKLELPESFEIASSLAFSNGVASVSSFHELVDSPIVASATLQHKSYVSHGIDFHLWFQGEVKPDWERLINDFQKFTDFQIEKFGGFPTDQFHFIFQIDTKKAYHGVEHLKSTMIYLGPSYAVFDQLYSELLGVCSHELYHAWNIKSIRPEEMFPYDYSRENYSRLGYVAEGVTTYMGDRVLLESGVVDDTQYHKDLGNYILRHLHNDGRKHYSVADSSWDTWLDGYVTGIPGRKTSIYVEGALIAYICDMRIRKSTGNVKSLHDAMHMLYNLTKNVGYSDATYLEVLEATAGDSFDDIFDDLINGTKDFLPYLEEALTYDGRQLDLTIPTDRINAYGIKGAYENGGYRIISVLEGSSADLSKFIPGDLIHAINGIALNVDLSEWLNYFEKEDISLQIIRNNQLKKLNLQKANENQYKLVNLKLV
ncbi:MAG: M61 family metallopeptidase [Flavobacteriales bacterium]|nr:M61 family metallopeptidase [Flavobacteriales bacterium]